MILFVEDAGPPAGMLACACWRLGWRWGRGARHGVFTTGAAEIDKLLSFCDQLRTNPASRARYAQTKRELADRTWRHVQHYADAKTAVVAEILADS